MRQQLRKTLTILPAAMLGGILAIAAPNAFAQQGGGNQQSAGTIDAQTGRILNEAIELLNAEDYNGAQAKLAQLNLDRLSPYERGKVEQINFNLAYVQEDYDRARRHLQASIDSGGLNDMEIQQARYQMAQLYMQEERWREGAAALEDWFKTATNPNSAAYYLLAAAYYQLEEYDRALEPAKKAVELMERPNENWIGMLLALYMQKDQYREAIPLLEQLISVAPDKKTYWNQLSAVHGQLEDYPKALAVLQLAYSAGLLTEDQELRRLADLLVFNDVPYRGGQILEEAIEKKQVVLDDKLYEKLANCWIAAGEFDKSIQPLTRAAELSSTGDAYVRLGEVELQRENWDEAIAAIDRGLAKGQVRDTAYAHLMLGIAYYNQKKMSQARDYFTRAANSERHRQTARSYLQAIEAQA
jgi:tetratricopeptide (TPR) repeat protein